MHEWDAGIDLFWCSQSPDPHTHIIPSGGSSLLGTGIAVEIPRDTMLEIKNKSSIASKLDLVVGACVVDCGYSGEIFVDIHNIGPDDQYIISGEKIAQAVLIPVYTPVVEEIKYTPYSEGSSRGSGGFGSTGSS